MTYRKLFTASVIAFGGLIIATAPASARKPIVVQANADVIERHISFADLNLAAASGQATLTRRVGSAVQEVCSESLGGNDGSMGYKLAMPRCDHALWAQARPQIDRAVLRAQQLASTGTTMIAATSLTLSLAK